MNTKILDQLEFNKVKDQFTEYLQTEQAQAELRNLVPMTNQKEFKINLQKFKKWQRFS